MKLFIKKSFERMLNRFLALDPESSPRLQKLNGKIIKMELPVIGLTFHILIRDGKMVLEKAIQENPDVIIKGTPLSLLHMSLAKSDRKRFFAEDVTIEGDLELGQHIIDLFDEMEIDWEEYLSRVTGDVPAHQFGRLVRGIKEAARRTNEALLQNINEYVHEEVLLFPQKEALQDFFADIDSLRMDADRLEARVKRLLVTLSPNGGLA